MVVSNGERLIVKYIVRNGSIWSDVFSFREGSNFTTKLDFETSELDFEVSKSKHTTSCDKGVFSLIVISQLRPSIELKFSQVCYFVPVLRYTMWEDWSLTITNNVQCLKRHWTITNSVQCLERHWTLGNCQRLAFTVGA